MRLFSSNLRNNLFIRITCLSVLKRYDECIEMIKKQLEEERTSSGLYTSRSVLHMMFGNVRFDLLGIDNTFIMSCSMPLLYICRTHKHSMMHAELLS